MLMQDQKIIHRVQIFMLHSSMQPFEQRKVFRKPPYGIRKVCRKLVNFAVKNEEMLPILTEKKEVLSNLMETFPP